MSFHPSCRPPTGPELAELLGAARRRLLGLVADLSDEQLGVPQLTIVNPILWELGHVAWFQEKWNLRHQAGRRSLRADADALFDSAAVPHDDRWGPQHTREQVLRYLETVLVETIARLTQREPTPADLYFAQLALLHEEMHVEALAYTRQTLALPAIGPGLEVAAHGRGEAPPGERGPLPGDVEVPGGTVLLGAEPCTTFVFDNEKWAHPVRVAPFRIARAATTNAEFAEFVDAGGYERPELWDRDGAAWLARLETRAPLYWRREPSGRWLRRRFDRWIPLAEQEPVMHVSWFEADAWCRWRGRRLPTEAEWELAACGEPGDRGGLAPHRRLFPWGDDPPCDEHAALGARLGDVVDVAAFPRGESAFGCRQLLGNVWEWTASDFGPYPGFDVDPYAEYSMPWFTGHKVLRGGCFVTQPHLLRNTWRNFYSPERRDVWAGFRSCAS